MDKFGRQSVTDVIDQSEEVADPLARIVKKVANDPDAAFQPQTLLALLHLRDNDPDAFAKLLTKLKRVGCPVRALEKAVSPANGNESRKNQASILVGLAESADFFHTSDGKGYADVTVKGHRETWPIRSSGFKRWLVRQYYQSPAKGAPSSEALQSALNVLEAKAQFDGPERAVSVRIAGLKCCVYIDLCDEHWRAIKIDKNGWRIVKKPRVRFRRLAGMKALPLPISGGSVDTLRSFVNVKSDADFVLIVSWILAALRGLGPYPPLALSGEQGSAKSTCSAILRSLLDPNTAALRALPRDNRDLFIAATNGFVLAFDNVSGLLPGISDTLCRLSTGGGFAVRQLYTDQDEVLFSSTRPIILNGIEDIVTRPDLADRSLFQVLQPIPEAKRRSEGELWAAFEAESPKIMGALFDAISLGLKRLPGIRLSVLPRMADFEIWATACETAFWPSGTFSAAYNKNRKAAVDTVIDADPIAAAIRAIMVGESAWSGTASALLDVLTSQTGDRVTKSKLWPDSPSALAGRLRRAATFLRTVGIEVAFSRIGRARTRTIRIDNAAYVAPEDTAAAPSRPHRPRRP